MKVVEKFAGSHQQQFKELRAPHALAAALLHDVGHGMFSHAFEAVGKEFQWPLARHEEVSQKLIRDSEITHVLDSELSKGFAENVADMIAQETPSDLYGSIVSSQFDADRLDYMQRDRLMTGVQSSGVDPTWLLANLEVAEVPNGVDDAGAGSVETLVLGPKAGQTAESYVLALFHLYPNVYLHKATRGAEMLFQALMRRLVQLHQQGSAPQSGLPKRHPILSFIDEPTNLDRAVSLDDSVFWGALPMLLEADDSEMQRLAAALRERHLMKCIDLRERVEAELTQVVGEKREQRQARVKLVCDGIVAVLKEQQSANSNGRARCLVDQYSRNPYKRFQDSKTPLNQILIRVGNGRPRDMGEFSPVIAHAEPFNLCRAYVFREDTQAEEMIENIMRTKLRETDHGNA